MYLPLEAVMRPVARFCYSRHVQAKSQSPLLQQLLTCGTLFERTVGAVSTTSRRGVRCGVFWAW